MNSSPLLHWIRSRPALLVAVPLVLMCVLGLAAALRPRRAVAPATLYTNSPPSDPTVIERPAAPVVTVPPAPPVTAPAPLPVPPPVVKTNPPFTGTHFHTNLPPETNAPPLGVYAPAGRLLRARLVNAVDSANTDTPIIALVTDDLWHDGQCVIPTGAELHGKASVNRLRERITSSGAWTVVWQSGEELVIEGIALDREEYPASSSWGITDGSAGLRGLILRSDSLAEIKLFVATFIAGAAAGLQEQRTTLLGDQVVRSTRNAALGGATEVMNRYAQQILETIQRDGIFVRVAGGKEMYLYVTSTIDLTLAKKGNLRTAKMPASAFAHLNSETNKP